MSEKSRCCYIGPATQSAKYKYASLSEQCKAAAEWTITFGPSPDDYTEACTAHVGELLVPDVGNVVLQVEEHGRRPLPPGTPAKR